MKLNNGYRENDIVMAYTQDCSCRVDCKQKDDCCVRNRMFTAYLKAKTDRPEPDDCDPYIDEEFDVWASSRDKALAIVADVIRNEYMGAMRLVELEAVN